MNSVEVYHPSRQDFLSTCTPSLCLDLNHCGYIITRYIYLKGGWSMDLICKKGLKGGACAPNTISLSSVPSSIVKKFPSHLFLCYCSVAQHFVLGEHWQGAAFVTLLRAAVLAWWVRVLGSANTLFLWLMQQFMPSSGFLCPSDTLKICLEVQDCFYHLQTMQSGFYLITHRAGVSSRPERRNSLLLLCQRFRRGWICAQSSSLMDVTLQWCWNTEQLVAASAEDRHPHMCWPLQDLSQQLCSLTFMLHCL